MAAVIPARDKIEHEFLNFVKTGGQGIERPDAKRAEIGDWLRFLDTTQLKDLIRKAISLSQGHNVIAVDLTNFAGLTGADNIQLAAYNAAIKTKVKLRVFAPMAGSSGMVDEGFWRPDVTDDNLKTALISMLAERAGWVNTAIVVPARREEANLEFDVLVEAPAPDPTLSWNRMGKTAAEKKSADRLFSDPTAHAAAALRDVDLAEVVHDVDLRLTKKSEALAVDSKDVDDSHYKDQAWVANLQQSRLVFEDRIETDPEPDGSLKVRRKSHTDDTTYLYACTIKKISNDIPVCITTSAAILNSPRFLDYTDERAITDDMAMHNVVQKTLSHTATSLVGSKIDYRFVHPRIRDAAGQPINNPSPEQIKTYINMAITALQSNIIPIFDRDLAIYLDRQLAAGLPEAQRYATLKTIQAQAASKTPADIKAAYNLFTNWGRDYHDSDTKRDRLGT